MARPMRIGKNFLCVLMDLPPLRKEKKMIKKAALFLYLLIIFLVVTDVSHAKDMERVLVAPQGMIQAGQDVTFIVYYNNLTNQNITSDMIYTPLSCLISNDDETLEGTAQPIETMLEKRTTIPGNGFRKVPYVIPLPKHMYGNIKIELSGVDANTAVFFAEKASKTDWIGEQISLNSTDTYFRPYVENFSVYKPMYFLSGVYPGIEKSSFQLSSKYRFFNKKGFLAEKHPWLTGFHFGYTQHSLWDLESDSAPFEDTSYMPEFFYLMDKIDLGISWVSAFGFQTGFQHESNGNFGTDSRSTNFAYIQPIIGFHLGNNYHLKLAPKIWAYINNDNDTNPDLDDYRGYYEIEAKIGNPESFVLGGLFRNGNKDSSYQLDLSYPLSRFLSGSLNGYFHLQYFNGYAETLLNYNEKTDAFRLGISIVR